MGANAKFLVLAVAVLILVFSLSVDFALSQGDHCSPPCADPNAYDDDGDDPYTAGWCTLETEECEDVTGLGDFECVEQEDQYFVESCYNKVLTEYFEDDIGEEICGSTTYDCSIRHCQGEDCTCGGGNYLDCSNCNGIGVDNEYYEMCTTCCYCCGDGVCNGEDCTTCTRDCGACPTGGGGGGGDGDEEHEAIPIGGFPFGYWPISLDLMSEWGPQAYSGVGEGYTPADKISFSGTISMQGGSCFGEVDPSVCSGLDSAQCESSPCCDYEYWMEICEAKQCSQVSDDDCESCGGCSLSCDYYQTEEECPEDDCYWYDDACYDVPPISGCIKRPAGLIPTSSGTCRICTCYNQDGGLCNSSHEQNTGCCPGHWCDASADLEDYDTDHGYNGRCCAVGSYWDNNGGVCAVMDQCTDDTNDCYFNTTQNKCINETTGMECGTDTDCFGSGQTCCDTGPAFGLDHWYDWVTIDKRVNNLGVQICDQWYDCGLSEGICPNDFHAEVSCECSGDYCDPDCPDCAPPTTTIGPDNGSSWEQISKDFTLACDDSVACGAGTKDSGCGTTLYKIIDTSGLPCDKEGTFTPSGTGSVTCPAGQSCDKTVCFYSNDPVGNEESIQTSANFHLETGPCEGRQCGENCIGQAGICNGTDPYGCYPPGGCNLTCTVPSPGANSERICYDGGSVIDCSGFEAACGRTDAYKCGDSHVCDADLTSCTTGGSPEQVTGGWASYNYPTGYYGEGDTFQITLSGISSPSGFTILAECKVNKSNGDVIYFNNWGSGDVTFSYQIQAGDPGGTWLVDYCGLFSDFFINDGWQLIWDLTDYSFVVDKTEPAVSVTGAPADWENTDQMASVSCTDNAGGSECDLNSYRLSVSSVSISTCPNDYNSYSPPGSQGITSHSWVCGAALDNVGNFNFSVPAEFKVDKTDPVANITGESVVWVTSDTVFLNCSDTGDSGCNTTRWYYFDSDSDCSTDFVDYTNSIDATISNALDIMETRTDYLCLWVEDFAGNHDINVSSRLMVDTNKPETPEVTDDGAETSSLNTLHASWSSSDLESGIAEYEYAIGTDQYPNDGWDSEVGWTNTVNAEETVTGLSLVHGQTYYFNVKAKNNAGLWSDVGSSDGITVNVCHQQPCGTSCPGGICNGTGYCFPGGDCLLDCSIPSPDERYCYDGGNEIPCSGFEAACGRTGVYKCGDYSLCNQSLTSCTEGGSPEQVTGGWDSYDYPTGSYTIDDEFTINLSGISSPSGFTILAECRVIRSNNSIIYFNNWGSGDVSFSYTIEDHDPDGVWTLDYCELWSDFFVNGGWQILENETNHTFNVDKTPPNVVIDNPLPGWYRADFDVNATASDDSGLAYVGYRWKNSTYTGGWNEMTLVAGVYTKRSDVDSVSDGNYTIEVMARDTTGLESSNTMDGIGVDKTGPLFEGYSVSGCSHPDIYSSTCWVKEGTTTTHQIRHSDLHSTPSRQYLAFTSNCNPDNCGCSWDQLCPTGNEIKSSVDVDTGALTGHMWNDDFLAIQSVSCSGVCTGTSVSEEWTVTTGSNEKDYKVYTLAYDEVLPPPGNEEGYTDTGWRIISDNTPPTTNVKKLPPYSGVVVSLEWEGNDGTGSGTDCYFVQYSYHDGSNNPPEWKNIIFNGKECTTEEPPQEFDLMEEFVIFDEDLLDGYVFYFRSLGKDKVGNLEAKGPYVNDTNTTIFIPELVELSAYNSETEKKIRNNGWFPRGKQITISAIVKDEVIETVDVVLNYSNHTRGGTPSWKTHACNNLQAGEKCEVTIGPFESGEVGYYAEAFGSWERNPPAGYMVLFIAEHPLCNFLTMDVMTAVLGSSGTIPIEVRNIQDRSDVVGLNLSNDYARFVETSSQYIEVPLNPMEEKTIYARLVPSSDNFQLVLGGNSSIDSTLFDSDTVEVIVRYPADFSGLSDFGILALVILAFLIYMKFVLRKE